MFIWLWLIFNCLDLVWLKEADFHSDEIVSTIAFGSCNKQDYDQPLWDNIVQHDPDIWLWLGDVVYADTRIIPFVWIPSSFESMKEKYDIQKQNIGYKKLLGSRTQVLGVWDDHDYGIDGGGKGFKFRLQSQKIFLDFLNEPVDSIRRKREGIYSSYSYGTGENIVKIILLDVRSHWVSGSTCDVLGEEQWKWLSEQLDDNKAHVTFIGTGKQVLSDIPFIDKWMSCLSSLDRLLFLAQKSPRIMFLSGDVHFSEINCLNSSGTGYPIYEVTSSGMTHTCSFPRPESFCHWSLQNVVASRHRISNVVTDKSFGIIKIDWESSPVKVNFELMGEKDVLSSFSVSLADLEVRRHPAVCPSPIEQPNYYWKRLFWITVGVAVIITALQLLRVLFMIGRWITLELLKDLDLKIKRRIEKLKTMLRSYGPKIRNTEIRKTHED